MMAPRKRGKNTQVTRETAQPVPGRVVRGNIFSPLHAAGGGLFLIILAWLVLSSVPKSDSPKAGLINVRPKVAIGYGLLLIVGSALLVSVLIVRNRRMVIGEDRLQLLGGSGRVIGQIPYDNIIDARLGAE